MCSWLLDTKRDSGNVSVRFVFREFETECGWDHLYIHDGDSIFSPMVAAYSGLLINKDEKNTTYEFSITFSGRYGYMHFYSDAAYTMSGFNISYSVGGCYLNCSGQGSCNDSKCLCYTGWTGRGCEVDVNLCLNNCSGVGICSNGSCSCNIGYRGSDCSTSESETLWERLISDNQPSGRASHAALVQKDVMWVLGGLSLSDKEQSTILTYDINLKVWSMLPTAGNASQPPWPLYGHSAVVYQDKIYVFGGVRNGRVVDELWVFDYQNTTSPWWQLRSSGYPLSGHTAYVVDDSIYVFFGYSSTYGYMNSVRLYNITLDEWSTVETSGSKVKGGFGHASAFDTVNRKVYIFGGYHSHSEASQTSSYNLTDSLYVFDLVSKQWLILLSSGSPRYLHTMVILGRYLLVFGGNTHNDTSKSRGAKCFSTDFILYDIKCNSWHTMPAAQIDRAARFGHSMVVHNGTLYMFGGFDSVMLNDIVKIELGNCEGLTNETECLAAIPSKRCVWNKGLCKERPESSSPEDVCQNKQSDRMVCPGYNVCLGCEDSPNCTWSSQTNICTAVNFSVSEMDRKDNSTSCRVSEDAGCELLLTCQACNDNIHCLWDSSVQNPNAKPCKPRQGLALQNGTNNRTELQALCTRQQPCANFNSCGICTHNSCMWCSNLAVCIDTNAYVASFPYGQCMDWTTKSDKCNATECFTQKSCSSCLSISKCGWCSGPGNNGLGVCMDGGMMGSRKSTASGPDYQQCPVDSWFFTNCPTCQCNGHSTCLVNSSVCESCSFPTTGSQCEQCQPFYYGNPVNGGNCTECQCNGQANSCYPVDGQCFCNTRGVTGKYCEKCDDAHKYSGDPRNGGTCYYGLSTDYQYTFNFSKPEDNNYTQVNFITTPSSPDRDVDFTLNCSGLALLNITFKSKNQVEMQIITSSHECDYFRTKFEHKDYSFGGDSNGTFYVYVYAFKTPFWLQISFAQPRQLDLLIFFIVFFSCFLSLLLIAAALWKIKHKYDSYRRRQQMMVEMQQMASRPFSSVCVEVDRKSDHATGGAPERKELRDHVDSALRRRKKLANKPSAIAMEPLTGGKAAVLTLLVQLPFGEGDFAPSGQSGVALGSALIAFSSNRKQSLEHIKGDKPKIRKNLYTHPDTLA